MGRPKGSKNKPKSTVKIPVENASFSVEIHDEDDSETNTEVSTANSNVHLSQEEHKSDIDSEVNSEASTVKIQQNILGTFIFTKNDNLTPLFCKIARIPNFDIRMTQKIKAACKKSLAKLCDKYIADQSESNLFNILVFWKSIKSKHTEKEKVLLDRIKQLGDSKGVEILSQKLDSMENEAVTVEEELYVEDEQNDFLSDAEIKRATPLVYHY
jgi:hypothetical protein